MNNQSSRIPPVLETAWKRFADYDSTAEQQQDQYYSLRRWVLYFSIAATFIAITIENFRTIFHPVLVTALQIILIALPIAGSVIIAYLSEFKQGQKYLAMRTGAEEVKKEIYLYRTLMQAYPDRKKWLNSRITEIQRQVHRSSGGEVVVKPYQGKHHNPYYDPDASEPGDEGIADLSCEEYMTLRLEDQLNWHIRKIRGHQEKRKQFIIIILIVGGIGSLLASIDFLLNGIAVWVALTTAISSAISNWKELLGLDMIVANYSKVILELNILRDSWRSKEPHEQTQPEFYKIVRATEKLLWNQNARFISAMREDIDDAEAEQQKIVEEMIEMSQEIAGQVQEEIVEEARQSMAAAASGQLVDDERIPTGAIFNVVLGPVESIILSEDEDGSPDGFEEDENHPTDENAVGTEINSSENNIEELYEEDQDPLLTAIDSVVTVAIEESDAVKSSTRNENTDNPEASEDVVEK
ncbi:DUF4231 domain-containing protein [Chloroflexota bacterium]